MRIKNAVLIAGAISTWCSGAAVTSTAAHRTQPDVGSKPFRISDSVTKYCAMKPRVAMCEEFEPRLADFLAESRDAKWAAPLEELIARATLVDGKQRFVIRTLECRRTLCAMEYTASLDDAGLAFDGFEQIDQHLELIGGVMAPELAPGVSGGVMLNALIWRKRA